MTWTTADIPDLTGRTAVITGVTGGLGTHVALELARRGATVIGTARNAEKARGTVDAIRAEVPAADLRVVDLDLADLARTKAAAAALLAEVPQIDILVNNAGIMIPPYTQTVDGFELQMATNHLGHFAWTAGLWPALGAARIVSVSSMAHTAASDIDFTLLTPGQAPATYRRWDVYGQSKLANLLFMRELDQRLAAAGSSAVSVAAHPGFASTGLTKTGLEVGGGSFLTGLVHRVSGLVAQSAAAGAQPLLLAATQPGLPGGSYVGPDGFKGMRGKPKLVGMTKIARDAELAAQLWVASETATGVSFRP